MYFTNKSFESSFEQELTEKGFQVVTERNGTINLTQTGNISTSIVIQLIISNEIDAYRNGSHNNNEVDGIGLFNFDLPSDESKPDYFILAFDNIANVTNEYVIVPTMDLVERINKKHLILNDKVEIQLWLMPDKCVYETTNISVEGEWYFISKGVGGRMADETERDYSKFLNNWDLLRKIL